MGVLGDLFAKRSTPLIGVDISSSSVKLLELSKKGDDYRIEAYAIEPLPPGAVNDRQIIDPDAVGLALAKALKRSGTRTRRVAAAVAGSSVITKIIQMPADLRELEMEEQIKLEADQYVPYPIDEVNLDFQVVGPTNNAPDTVDVLLAACRTETIDARVMSLDKVGLQPVVMDTESNALENACQLLFPQMPNGGEKTTVALIDIGAGNTVFMVAHDRKIIYRREQAFGGRQLTEDIMRHYGMSQEEANNAKRLGGLPDDYDTEVLPYFIDDLTQQIDRSLQLFFANSPKFNELDQVILSGGSANIPNLADRVQENLGVPVAIATPFKHISVASKAGPQQLAQDETSLLLAFGLAMRAFD
jgi:type IV pilus assembly protein PilM